MFKLGVLLFSAVLLLATGCQSPVRRQADPGTAGRQERVRLAQRADQLSADLEALGSGVASAEAARLAGAAVEGAAHLAGQYRAVRPAWLQNMLVNTGLKPRGLCYHWADDLRDRLASLGLRTLEVHRVVARGGTSREHNGIAVCAAGQSPDGGLVLDAWRWSGELYWGPLAADKYPWKMLE